MSEITFQSMNDYEKEVFVCCSMDGYDLRNFYGKSILKSEYKKAIHNLICQGVVIVITKYDPYFKKAKRDNMMTYFRTDKTGIWLHLTVKGNSIFFEALSEEIAPFGGFDYLVSAETKEKDKIFREAFTTALKSAIGDSCNQEEIGEKVCAICDGFLKQPAKQGRIDGNDEKINDAHS